MYALSINTCCPFYKDNEIERHNIFSNLHMKKHEGFPADVVTIYEIGGPLMFPHRLLLPLGTRRHPRAVHRTADMSQKEHVLFT